MNRRRFLGTAAGVGVGVGAGAGLASAAGARLNTILDALESHPSRSLPASAAAADEDYWLLVQQAFMADRAIVNLNNAGVSPCATSVHDATRRRLELANTQPPPHVLWQVQHPMWESVRSRLAQGWGVDAEEIAITRNSSESMQILQMGLKLSAGDEIVTSSLDYPRMVTAFRQRERRDGVVVRQVELPVPCEDHAEIVRRFEKTITDRTRMILTCHVINRNGQVMPVKALCELGRARGIPVLIDGAQAFAHLDFKISDLGCEYYGVSLHKWLAAPIGTGLLYVRRDRIKDVWPLMAAPETLDADIRKFEETGTRPEALALGISEALALHQAIGGERKEARLRYLRDRIATRALATGRVVLHSSMKPEFSCGILNFRVEGVDTNKLREWLWNDRKILTVAIQDASCAGLRISPNVYTTLEETDRFGDAIEWVIKRGLPG